MTVKKHDCAFYHTGSGPLPTIHETEHCPYYVWLTDRRPIVANSDRCRTLIRSGRRLCVGCPARNQGGEPAAADVSGESAINTAPEARLGGQAEPTLKGEKMKRETLCKILARLRKENGLSQGQAAATVKIHQTALSRWERGLSTPNPEQLRALDALYGSDLAERYGETPAATRTKKKPAEPSVNPVEEQSFSEQEVGAHADRLRLPAQGKEVGAHADRLRLPAQGKEVGAHADRLRLPAGQREVGAHADRLRLPAGQRNDEAAGPAAEVSNFVELEAAGCANCPTVARLSESLAAVSRVAEQLAAGK